MAKPEGKARAVSGKRLYGDGGSPLGITIVALGSAYYILSGNAESNDAPVLQVLCVASLAAGLSRVARWARENNESAPGDE
jgi:hypothetical protein